MKHLVAATSVLALLLGWNFAAHSEAPIGQAVSAIETVHASTETERRNVVKSDPVFKDELIETGNDSYAGLSFNDGSTLAIGPNANVLLDDFVYDDNSSSQKMVVTIAKGAIRFTSGKLRKGRVAIRTPIGTVGIRGTVFAIFVDAAGQVTVFVQQGVVAFTNAAGQVVQVLQAGQSITFSAPPGGTAQPTGQPGPLPANLASALQGMTGIQPTASSSGSGTPPGVPAVVTTTIGNVQVSNIATAIAAAQSAGAPAGSAAAAQAASGELGQLGLISLGVGAAVGVVFGTGLLDSEDSTTTTTTTTTR